MISSRQINPCNLIEAPPEHSEEQPVSVTDTGKTSFIVLHIVYYKYYGPPFVPVELVIHDVQDFSCIENSMISSRQINSYNLIEALR